MDSRTKKITLIAFMVLIVIAVASFFYNVKNSKDFEFKTGKYFCKIDIINEGTKKVFQLFSTLLLIFLFYKISIYFVELNGLYKDINFYFNLI